MDTTDCIKTGVHAVELRPKRSRDTLKFNILIFKNVFREQISRGNRDDESNKRCNRRV